MVKTKKKPHIAIFTAMIMLWCARAQSQSGPQVLERLEGYWLNQKTLSTLKETRSPSKSLGKEEWTAFEVRKVEGQYSWFQNIRFHEGDNKRIMRLDAAASFPRQYTVICEPVSSSTDTFLIDNVSGPQQILWRHEQSEPFELSPYVPVLTHKNTFVRIDRDYEHFINHMLLVGLYQDEQGRRYEFTDDMQARWPDKTFMYGLLLDGVMGNDSFLKTNIVYHWKDDHLLLSHYSGDIEEGNYIEGPPFAILHRMASPK